MTEIPKAMQSFIEETWPDVPVSPNASDLMIRKIMDNRCKAEGAREALQHFALPMLEALIEAGKLENFRSIQPWDCLEQLGLDGEG